VVKSKRKEDGDKEGKDEFEIYGIYLLNTEGIILSHKDTESRPDFDVDIFGSMFTAIKIFIEDSMKSESQLECINFGGFKILIENGEDFFMVLIGTGVVTDSVKSNMRSFMGRIRDEYGEVISHWNGDVSQLMEFDRMLDSYADSFKMLRDHRDYEDHGNAAGER
jgi:hypothetical protein